VYATRLEFLQLSKKTRDGDGDPVSESFFPKKEHPEKQAEQNSVSQTSIELEDLSSSLVAILLLHDVVFVCDKKR
jgi:hypothetical protein